MFWNKQADEEQTLPRSEKQKHYHAFSEVAGLLATISFDQRFLQPENWAVEMFGSKKVVSVLWEEVSEKTDLQSLSSDARKRVANKLFNIYKELTETQRLMMSSADLLFREAGNGEGEWILDPRSSLALYDNGKMGKVLGDSYDPFWKAIMDFPQLGPVRSVVRLAFLIYRLYEGEPPYDLLSQDVEPNMRIWFVDQVRMEATPFRPYRAPMVLPKPLASVVTNILAVPRRECSYTSPEEALLELKKALRVLDGSNGDCS